MLAVRNSPNHRAQAAVQALTTQSRIRLCRALCLPRSPFGCVSREANWILLGCCLKLATMGVGSATSWEQSNVRRCLFLALDNLSDATKQSAVLLFLLGLHMCREDQIARQGHFYQHWLQRQVSRSPNAP